ncbi:protein-L-isoaspartate O-methyltransferase [Agrococcus sp. ARC_14]|uniref:protein-L-isoaspartate O-methyltransferase family protein n=1 Tax=Agrococcus sp. ARC_14 TaxID=2919927 RepID=UPI001F066A1A|nr:protein-L-isoaspartate O-methyltransferase [Agrococcus sp. ARC_14]MCH1881639.1 protein-L-isoaspartate O-methyltransferase [Agrococcus sp. ARC_14]
MNELPVAPDAVERVRAAMRTAERRAFLPPSVRQLADVDRPIGIGWDATNSQPSTVARMLELLDARPGHRTLDVGAGSGWTTAILAALGAETTGVELVPQLVEQGNANLTAHGTGARIRQATPGILGLPDDEPWDRILVSADFGRMPDALVAQLADGGRMVAPIAGRMTVVDLSAGRTRIRHDSGRYAFVPLRS